MKQKNCFVFLFFFSYIAFFHAQPVFNSNPVPMTGVMSLNPKTVSQGFAYTANAFGYNSFFYNPAGFAMEHKNRKTGKTQNGDITALSISAWALTDTKFFSAAEDLTGYVYNIENRLKTLESQLTDIAKGLSNGGDVSGSLSAALKTLADMPGVQSVYDGITGFMLEKTEQLPKPPTYEEIQTNPDLITKWVNDNIDEIESIITNPDLQTELVQVTAKAFSNSGVVTDLFSFFPSHVQAGFNVGFGLVKKGLGLGFMADFDMRVTSDTTVHAILSPTLMFSAGYAFKLLENKLLIGFNVRPMLKFAYFRFDFSETNILNLFTNPKSASTMLPIYSGFGIGLDFGAIYKLNNNINLGLVLKDAPTFFQMYKTDIPTLFRASTVKSVNFFGERVKNLFYVPPDLIIGASWQFNPNSLFTLNVSAQIGNWIPQIVYLNYYGVPFNPAAMFGAGVSMEILKFLTVNAGFGNSFLTAGVGFNFWLIDINIAAMYNPTIIAKANSFGVSIEIAIRF